LRARTLDHRASRARTLDHRASRARARPDLSAEQALAARFADRHVHGPVCGIDEAGRGPWAGPVTAAAVVLDPGAVPAGLDDSKRLGPAARQRLADEIEARALAFSVVCVPAQTIDEMNILRASLHAMSLAVRALSVSPVAALIDGVHVPHDLPCPGEALVGGDGRSASIAAASILAKVARDRLMIEADALHPGYGFARHKGYGTPEHAAALARLGPCALHRTSFAPVRRALDANTPQGERTR
jgi:ribonuclease HII